MKWSWPLFSDYWLVVEIVLYWVSSEFLTQMVSSQLVFNLLSSQECIHRLYHWEEWLPSLVWSRSGNVPHQHMKVGLLFDWWLLGLILQRRCQLSHRLDYHRCMDKPTREQTLPFLPGKWLNNFSPHTRLCPVPVLLASRAWITFTLVLSSRLSSREEMGMCYGKRNHHGFQLFAFWELTGNQIRYYVTLCHLKTWVLEELGKYFFFSKCIFQPIVSIFIFFSCEWDFKTNERRKNKSKNETNLYWLTWAKYHASQKSDESLGPRQASVRDCAAKVWSHRRCFSLHVTLKKNVNSSSR